MLLQSFEATIRSPYGNGQDDEITIPTYGRPHHLYTEFVWSDDTSE